MSEFLLEWEGIVLLWIQNCLRGPLTDPLFSFYTKLGNMGMLWLAASMLMLCFKRTRRAGMAGLLALAVGFVLTNLMIKPLVGRVRPWLTVEGLTTLVAEHDPYSFPSGHTCAAFAAVYAWRPYLSKGWGNTALICAVLMGLSRIYVGVHFPTDVLAGALAGYLSARIACQCKKIVSHHE